MGYNNPHLDCDYAASSGPCRRVPSTPIVVSGNTYWMFGKGVNVAMADSSAKFRKMGMNINGKTDYKTDWLTRYDTTGFTTHESQDTNFCHTMLYQPDFDFQNFGTPVE